MKSCSCWMALLLCVSHSVGAQFDTTLYKAYVTIHTDTRIGGMISKQKLYYNRLNKQGTSQLYRGYRVQLISTPDRDEAIKIRNQLLVNQPDLKLYFQLYEPNYKVRVGNFITEKEATALKDRLYKAYPALQFFVVNDWIEEPPSKPF